MIRNLTTRELIEQAILELEKCACNESRDSMTIRCKGIGEALCILELVLDDVLFEEG